MNSARRILVIAPHPDDEVLGCGGTLALARGRGAEVSVLVVFDGAAGDPAHKFDEDDYVERRKREACAAGECLGLTHYHFWNLPEGHLLLEPEVEAGAERLAHFIVDWRPDLLLAPWPGDAHRDHQSVARAVERLLQGPGCPCPVWGFEVWSALSPERLVDVSRVWPAKLEAIARHRTQLAYADLAARSTRMAERHAPGLHEAFCRYGMGA